MNKERYESLMNDKATLKGTSVIDGYFKTPFEDFVIHFVFSYLDHSTLQYSIISKKRISLELFPKEKLLDGITPTLIYQNLLVLANCDAQDYALSYQLSVDTHKRCVAIILLDEPWKADKLLTKEEKEGITLSFDDLLQYN